ncbi:FSH1 domain-containing protein [Pycnococcus provasolii]
MSSAASGGGGSSPVLPHKGRLIALHGNGTSSDVLKVQIATLQQHLSRAGYLLEFVDGTFTCEPSAIVKQYFPRGPFLHYAAKLDDKDQVTAESTPPGPISDLWRYENLERAATLVEEEVLRRSSNVPVVGVVGFSQGANLAAYLVARASCGKGQFALQPAPSMGVLHGLGVAVLMSPIKFGWMLQPDIKSAFEAAPIDAAVAVVVGAQDPARDRGEKMLEYFDASRRTFHEHSRGHQPLPSDREEKLALTKELTDFICAHV